MLEDVSMKDFLHYVMEHAELIDLEVAGVPIEEIIKDIYTGKDSL